jgi:hypothetical protein
MKSEEIKMHRKNSQLRNSSLLEIKALAKSMAMASVTVYSCFAFMALDPLSCRLRAQCMLSLHAFLHQLEPSKTLIQLVGYSDARFLLSFMEAERGRVHSKEKKFFKLNPKQVSCDSDKYFP